MSDARYAPLYCENILEYFSYSKCPEGFSEFPRVTSGQRWCHKYVHGAPLPYDDAEKKCAEMGAHLSGFTTQEEFKFLNGMLLVLSSREHSIFAIFQNVYSSTRVL